MHARPSQPVIASYKLYPNGLTYYPFYHRDDANYVFSNFWPQSITAYGNVYPTPEHYFQMMKMNALLQDPTVPYGIKTHPSIQKAIHDIATQPLPGDARKAANVCTQQLEGLGFDFQSFWAARKVSAFVEVIRQRTTDYGFVSLLSGTGDAYLVEDTHTAPHQGGQPDIYNGAGPDGMGLNELGWALTMVREELKLKRMLTQQEHDQLRQDFELNRQVAQTERQRLDAQANKMGQATYGVKFQDLCGLASRLYAGNAPRHANRNVPHAAGFKSADVSYHDVPDVTKEASKEISRKINTSVLGLAPVPVTHRETPPIVRPGRMPDRDTCKFAFDNAADANRFYQFLLSKRLRTTYYGDNEQYPLSANLRYIVRLEDKAQANQLLKEFFGQAQGQDLHDKVMHAKYPSAALKRLAPSPSRAISRLLR